MSVGDLAGRHVTVVEVGPRDGLQNEAVAVPTTDKIAFVDQLSAAGLPVIEVSAFVSPKWVPQMSDAVEVFAGITRRPGVRFTALVPNLAGLDRAVECGVSEIAIFAASTETFSRKNINQTIGESLHTYAAVSARARDAGVRVRAYLSTAFGCPYEGPVDERTVTTMVGRLLELGVFEVAVSDTLGVATPGDVARVLDTLLEHTHSSRVALHFHDTRRMAVANVLTALSYGITTFDASAGGLGGCPYAPGAAGNLATDDLIYMLNGLGVETGVSLAALKNASETLLAKLRT